MDDLIDFTPELRKEALEIVRATDLGRSTHHRQCGATGRAASRERYSSPVPSAAQTGRVEAFDPETGILYVESITGPFVADIVKGDPKQTNLDYLPGLRVYPAGPQGLPLLKPPYGRITAIDLNKGELLWTVANGDGPRDHPLLKPLNLPPLGNPGRSAPLLTRTLLFVGEGDPVMVRAGNRLPAGMPVSIAPGAGERSSAPTTRPPVQFSGRRSCPPARRARR